MPVQVWPGAILKKTHFGGSFLFKFVNILLTIFLALAIMYKKVCNETQKKFSIFLYN